MTPSILDFNQLLQPISKNANGVGANLREDVSPTSRYHQLKELRMNARQVEKKFVEQETEENAIQIWKQVHKMALDILITESKDLEVTAWLIEALLRLHEVPGLRDGFLLARQLIERYWGEIYPQADEDGIEIRIAALGGLNGYDAEGTLIVPISFVHLTQGSSLGPFAAWQYQQALDLGKLKDLNKLQQHIDAGAVSLEMIQKAVKESKAEFYRTLGEDLQACQQAFSDLTAILTDKCGADAPPSSNIKSALEALEDQLRFLLQDSPFALQASTVVEAENQSNHADKEMNTASTIQTQGEVNDRKTALQLLTKVADYFAQHEPHSPLPYVLQRAIRWGNLPLPDLLAEMIEDGTARDNVYNLTGIAKVE